MNNEITAQSTEKKSTLNGNVPIIIILFVSAFLNVWNIWTVSFANKYYAAGVYSMGQNLHAFFFNSFDSVGFVTIDKPPLGFWIQTLFTKVFGFSGAVLILPQAIAAVVSVYLIYRIITKRFSKGAGLVAAAVLALTPIFVAVSRNNTIDGIMILLLVLASEQALRAAQKASMKHLILAGVFIGLGFNVKMLQAYVIVPAIYLVYLIFAKQKFMKKVLVCAVAFIVMVVISLSWVMIVDMVPEDNRPYIGSSDTNSAVNLAIGYNGINRIINQRTQPNNDNINNLPDDKNINPNIQQGNRPLQQNNQLPPNQQTKPANNLPTNKMAGGESGEAGIFRLYNEQNAGQISWFVLPSIFVCILMLALIFKRKFKSNAQNIALLFFALCFIPIFIYFSFASGLAHRYYFATAAPFVAGLIGIGFYYLMRGKKYWFPIIFVPTALTQLYIQYLYKGWFDWLIPTAAIIFSLAAVGMIIAAAKNAKKQILAILLCTLLLLPAFWSATPMMYDDNSQLPIAGPELEKQSDKFDNELDLTGLVDYLQENRDGATYLAMTPSSMTYGAELILQSGEAVMALGGFNGGDTVASIDEFIKMVENNDVRFAVIDDNINKANGEIYQWIINNGTIVRPKEYGGKIGIMRIYKLS